MDMLLAIKEDRQKEEIERCRRELKKADRRMEELTKTLNKLYEDVALEKISEDRYQAMRQSMSGNRQSCAENGKRRLRRSPEMMSSTIISSNSSRWFGSIPTCRS